MKKGDGQAYRVPQAPPNERLSVAGAERRDRDRASRKRAANQTLAVFLTALQGSACIVELDNDRRAEMVGNLLVVLCGDRGTQPVVQAGTGKRG